MADRSVLFSAPMVRALLNGRKTQTRRILKPQPEGEREAHNGAHGPLWVFASSGEVQDMVPISLRFAKGDRLWVREAWRCHGWATDVATIMYRAGEGSGYTAMTEQYPVAGKAPMRVTSTWRPGIHMPRWASRLTLTVTDVRVERLQDISRDDVLAEGCPVDPDYRDTSADGSCPYMVATGIAQWQSPRAWYHRLWDAINGAESWAANPWVVALTFTVERRNIDG